MTKKSQNSEGAAGKLTRKSVATYTLSWFMSSQNNIKYFPPYTFNLLACHSQGMCAQSSWETACTSPGGANIQTHASHGNQPPQAVHIAGMQTLLLHRSTKTQQKRLLIEHMLLGVLRELSGWSPPQFQAFIQDPDLSPKIISQLFSGTHAVQAQHSAQGHAPPVFTAQIPSQIGHLNSLWYRLVALYSDFPSLS